MGRRLVVALVAFICGGACQANPGEGVFECASNAQCPPHMLCRSDGFCYRTGDVDAGAGSDGGALRDGAVDAAMDAAHPDATILDASPADATLDAPADGGVDAGPPPPCAIGHLSSDGTRCYQLNAAVLSWSDARAHCAGLGGYLVTITSDTEQAEVWSIASTLGMPAWIGATDESTEGTWRWVNGEAWLYERWATSPVAQPDNAAPGQHCATMWPEAGGEWDDSFCSSVFPSVCEVEL